LTASSQDERFHVTFFHAFEAWGERPALVFPGGRVITYGALARRMALLRQDMGREKRLVAIEAANSEHAIVTYLAALAGGHAVALIAPGDRDAMEEFVRDVRPDMLFRTIDSRWRRETGEGGTPLHPDLALLLATSGSTGKSRFVRLSAASAAANAGSIADYLELAKDDRAALILPFHYSYGLSVLNAHLAVGASVFVAAKGVLDEGFAAELAAAGCTNISGVPYSYELMERVGLRRAALPKLRFMTVAGGRMPAELAETYRLHLAARGGRFFVMYGQTEATARIAYVPPQALADNADTIGIAIPGGTLGLVDAEGKAVETVGQVGELVYAGPNVMMGYATVAGDLAKGHEHAVLRTGDLAERRPNGFFRIVGRLKRISKIGGLRISHDAIEHALGQKGMVAAVSGDDRRLVAAFTSDHRARDVRIAMIAASGLGGLHVEAVKVDALPRLPSGKVDHQAIARMRAGADEPAADVLQAFNVAFFPRRVTRADSFESLGGDSLAYVQLSQAIERHVGHIPMGWETKPVGGLCDMARLPEPRRTLDTELVLRAAAILLIVVHHATLWPIPGGAAALMLLVGYGFARFQSRRLLGGDISQMLRALAAALAVYFPLVAGFSIARGEILWPSFLLVGNLGIFDYGRMMPYLYWFVEAYAQTVLVWCGLFLLPPVRRMAGRRPFGFALALLGVAVALKFLTPLAWPVGAVQIFTAPDVFYLAVFGWAVFFARERRQKLLLMGLAVLLFPLLAWYGGNWTGSWVKFSLQIAMVALLLFVPRLAVPKQAAALVLPVAGAGYHIYLFHRILPELFLPRPDAALSQPLSAALAVAVGVLSGLIVYRVQRSLIAALAALSRRRRPSGELVTPAAE